MLKLSHHRKVNVPIETQEVETGNALVLVTTALKTEGS